jgi:hypothetical protein
MLLASTARASLAGRATRAVLRRSPEVVMRPLRSTVAAILLSGLFVPCMAHGAKKSAPSAAAALVVEGRKLMAAGQYAEACPKLADAQSREPAPTTAIALATCYEKWGKLATAWATFRAASSAADSAGMKKIAAAANRMAAALEPKVSHLTIKAPPDASGIEVRLDHESVPRSDWGSALARDGGGHDIEVSAPGKKAWTEHVDLGASGQNLEVDIPRLADDRSATAGTTDASGAAPSEATSPVSDATDGQGQRTAGIAVGAVGVLAVGLGAFAGLHAHSTYKDALAACGGSSSCAPGTNGLTLRQSASTWATVSTASFIGAGVALAGGAVLFFTAPRGRSGPTVGVGPAAQGTGLSVVGRF